jgi:hypothetical protein
MPRAFSDTATPVRSSLPQPAGTVRVDADVKTRAGCESSAGCVGGERAVTLVWVPAKNAVYVMQVTLTQSFHHGRYEVAQDQYEQVMAAEPAQVHG